MCVSAKRHKATSWRISPARCCVRLRVLWSRHDAPCDIRARA